MTKEEFAQVVLDSTDSLYRISKSILKHDADCEDAVQEAITIAFEKLLCENMAGAHCDE